MPDDSASGFTVADAPPPETDDEAIARLASMTSLEYERCRVDEAKRLKTRAGELDKLVQVRRGETEDTSGRRVALHDPEPWPEPVATDAVLDDLAAALKRHLILPPSAADI